MTRALADLGRGGWNPAGWQRPTWADAVLLRRMLAAALTALAAFLFLRGDPGAERTPVLVAARDLAPGRLLEAGDLHAAPREAPRRRPAPSGNRTARRHGSEEATRT
ncbi:hypothetical protein ACWDSF_21560, partial [Nocardia beijingensis]